MKIGIITFHCAYNYGAVLQAFALKRYLQTTGYKDVEIIDYRPSYLIKKYSIFSPQKFGLDILKELIKLPSKIKRRHQFESFISKYLSPVEDKKEWKEFDFYILGSDQIWNPFITGFDEFYFGKFSRKSSSKIISYAPSLELVDLKGGDIEKIIRLSANINNISVRETTMLDVLKDNVDYSLALVVDPTLLVNPQVWNKFVIKKSTNERYILLYQVRTDHIVQENAIKMARDKGCKLKIIVSNRYNIPFRDIQYIKPSPLDFLSVIYNAEMILSSSFHGVVFSLIFHKEFYAIKLDDNRNDRIISLLSQINLSDRIIEVNQINELPFSPIEYTSVDDRIDKIRKKSEDFIRNALREDRHVD